MRNLVLESANATRLPPSPSPSSSASCVCIAYDPISDSLFALLGHGELLLVRGGIVLSKHSLMSDESALGDSAHGWLRVDMVRALDRLVCCAASGHIVSVLHCEDDNSFLCEEEGCVDAGVAAAAWSPDQTRLLLVTKAHSLLLLSAALEPLAEVALLRREGSPAALSWRGDAEAVCVLFTPEGNGSGNGNGPSVRLYSSGLELLAEGRNVAEGEQAALTGLHNALAVAPNGSLVALAQRLPHRPLQVVFLEMNGLRHGHFDVRVSDPSLDVSVLALSWDTASSVLAVELSTGELQLYARGNYHWYLKLQLNAGLLGFDPEVSGRLHVLGGQDRCSLLLLELVWDACVGEGCDCSAAVVDGAHLLLTPLALCVIPPPMCRHRLALSAPCTSVSTWTSMNSPYSGLLVLTSSGRVALYSLNAKGEPSCIAEVDLAQHFSLGHLLLLSAQCVDAGETLRVLVVALHLDDQGQGPARSELLLLSVARDGSATAEGARTVEQSVGRLFAVPSQGDDGCWLGYATCDQLCSEAWRIDVLRPAAPPLRMCSFPERVVAVRFARWDETEGPVLVGLSARNRLYCGDALIFAGVSSFALNIQLCMLLFLSVGTKPHLHMLPAANLTQDRLLERNRDGDQSDNSARPVERGSRLVGVVAGGSRVVVQMPRGNLETFEPRPLLLMQARAMLDEGRLLPCLSLLRRQKIDLNLAVDHSPEIFLANVQPLVRQSLEGDGELLNLLLAGLEDSDVGMCKYGSAGRHLVASDKTSAAFFASKVNTVCAAIRAELLVHLSAGNLNALHPALCTYAKHEPPLIVEALQTIRRALAPEDDAMLAHTAAQAALKFLAFLVDGERLFRAALGECDFNMCRAVARQTQMDPKLYLPLLKGFEGLLGDGGRDPASPLYCYVRYRACMYLEDTAQALEWGAACLTSASALTEPCPVALDEVVAGLLGAAVQRPLVELGIRRVAPALVEVSGARKRLQQQQPLVDACEGVLVATRALLDGLRERHGDLCAHAMDHRAAVASYLLMTPPKADKAVRAARSAGDWQLALLLCKQHAAALSPELSATRVAHEIVEEYRSGLEQGQSADYDDLDQPVDPTSDATAVSSAAPLSRALEASQICLDYCKDAETAVGLLLSTRSWMSAMQLSMRMDRADLFKDEVACAVRASAAVLVAGLQRRAVRHAGLVQRLAELWREPEERLRLVAETDPSMLPEADADEPDTSARSEFSGASSFSSASNASSVSLRSGTSTVSVLSNLMAVSTVSTSPSAFSIEGIDHALLSRGKDNGHTQDKERRRKDVYIEKRERKKERKRGRGSGRDTMELRLETDVCEELLTFARLEGIARHVRAVSEALLLLGDRQLLGEVHVAMDAYVNALSSSTPPCAPLYPRQWLQGRAMQAVLCFQDLPPESSGAVSWWSRVAQGVVAWRALSMGAYVG